MNTARRVHRWLRATAQGLFCAGWLLSIATVASAQVTWDGGGGADTNINTAANWTNDIVNPLNGSTNAVFSSTSTAVTATINVDAAFRPFSTTTPAIDFNRSFTLASGAGNLTVYASNSGASTVLRAASGAASVVINETLNVFATSPVASPLGNLLVIAVNNTTASGTALNLTAGIALAAGSGTSTYDIRFVNPAGSTFAKARIGGTITGLGAIQNGNGNWAGDLLIAGNQSLPSSNITTSTSAGFGTPATTARIVLGEAAADVQTWNNVTLNSTMNVAVSGTATINALAGTGSSARITGNNIAGATLKITSGSAGTGGVMIGGTGTGWNTLSVVKQNAGTLTMSGTHTYSGSTSVDGGTLSLLADAQLSTSGIAVNNGGTLTNAATALSTAVTVNAGGILGGEGTAGSLTFGSGTTTFNYDPATAGGFTAASVTANAGGLVLLTPSSATTTGSTYLVMTNSAGFSSGVPVAFAPSARGSLGLAASNTQLTFTPTAAATLTWTGSASTDPTYWNTINAPNWTAGGQVDRFYSGDGVTFDDTATGTSVVVQGGNVTPGNVTFANATKDFTFAAGNAIVGSGTVTKSGAGSVTLNNNLQNTGGIVVSGGRLSLSGSANTITGITVSGGTLALASTTGSNTFSSGTIGISGGELQFANTVPKSLGSQPVTLSGGAITYSGTATTTSDTQSLTIATGGGVNVDTASTITWRVGGVISGTGDWTKGGAGVLAIGRSGNTGAANTFSGKLRVNAGTLDIRHANSLGASGSLANGTEINGATLLMQNFGQTSGTTVVVPETLSFTGASLFTVLNQEAKSFTDRFTGPMSVSGTLGVGTAITSGATVPAFELAGGIDLAAGSRLAFGRVGTLPVTTVASAQAVTVTGAITGAGSVVVEAAGNYVLSGVNTYSGSTTVQAGRLAVNGSLGAGTVTVNNGATLGGSGTIGGLVSVLSGGTLSPGNSPGLLTVGSLLLGGASTTGIEFTDSLVRGTGYDGIDITTSGGLTYGGLLSLAFGNTSAFTDNTTLDIFGFTGSTAGAFSSVTSTGYYAGTWTNNNDGTFKLEQGNQTLTFSQASGDVVVVPEPSTLALLGLGGLLAAVAFRRRRGVDAPRHGGGRLVPATVSCVSIRRL